MRKGLPSFTITPNDSLTKFLLPVTVTLCSAGIKVLVPKGEMLPPGMHSTSNYFNKVEVKTATRQFWTSHASASVDKRSYYTVWVIDDDYQGEIELLLHKGGKEEYV